jgi:excisionase family DNA binding protein
MSEHQHITAQLPDPRVQPTVTVDFVAEILGVGRQCVYRAVRTGEIPSIRVGRLIRVPTARLLALLGQEQAPTAEAHQGTADALAAS